MSASPQRFDFVPQNTRSDVALSPETRLSESDFLARLQEVDRANKKWQSYTVFSVFLTFVAGVLAGYFLYLLWEQVGLHDGQIARQQIAIDRLSANEAAVSNQVNRLKSVDGSVDSLRAQLEAQGQKLAELEKGQSGMRDQMTGMDARWKREVRELGKAKPTASPASSPTPPPASPAVSAAPPPSTAPAAPVQQQPSEKHNETFSPDLKPMPNAYAQMSPNGLVVWMTPRPGFAKPVPTSVIGQVRGLGILVHDWDDNNHYFITESGSWIPDQR